MHIHQSVRAMDTGMPLFATGDGDMSKHFMHYIGGLQHYIPQLLPLFAPNVNAFRRFLAENCAPVNVAWGHDNRTVGLRVPCASAAAMRVENRLPGADANPYLALAATLLCGYLGMREQLEPTAPLTGRAYDHCGLNLPDTLEAALARMEVSDKLSTYMGDRFVQGYVAVKRTEHRHYRQVISTWEREYLQMSV